MELEIIVQAHAPEALVIVLLAPSCIARLCLGKGHRDRFTRELVFDPHFHSWEANKPSGTTLPQELPRYEILPAIAQSRDEAIAWFLKRAGIESPAWLPVRWPDSENLV